MLAVMGAVAGGVCARLHAGTRSRSIHASCPSLDQRRRLRGTRLDPASDDRSQRIDRGLLRRRTCRTMPLTSARRCSRSRRARWRSMCRRSTAASARSLASRISFRAPRPAAPASGSTCFCAGWCVRTRSISVCGRRCGPVSLIVPLDTHIIRVGQCLRLTKLKSPGLAHGRRHHRVAARHRSRSIRSSSTSRSATWA